MSLLITQGMGNSGGRQTAPANMVELAAAPPGIDSASLEPEAAAPPPPIGVTYG